MKFIHFLYLLIYFFRFYVLGLEEKKFYFFSLLFHDVFTVSITFMIVENYLKIEIHAHIDTIVLLISNVITAVVFIICLNISLKSHGIISCL